MASYRGVTLLVEAADGFVARWRREPNVVRTHIPGAGADRVQVLGRGNPRVRLRLFFETDADYAALEALVADGQTGVLDDPFGDGLVYSNVGLIDLADPVRRSWGPEWEAQAEFEAVQ
jgi:hypothetical protein